MRGLSGTIGKNLPLTVAGAVPALALTRRTVFPFSPLEQICPDGTVTPPIQHAVLK